jgi:hypothetical protein
VDDPIENIKEKIIKIRESRDNYKVMENITNTLTVISNTIEDGFLLVGSKIKDLYAKISGLDKRILKIEDHKPKDGYTPIKGKDYFDGRKGEDGKTPIKGVDYFDGEKGKNGRDGKDGRDGRNGKDGKNGITKIIREEVALESKDIKNRLEGLKGEDRLDAKAIKNLPIGGTQRIGSGGFRKFKELEDTPSNYIGQSGKILAVKSNEKGIEFIEASEGGLETDPVYTADKPNIALKSEIPDVPTKISELENDSGYLTEEAQVIPTKTSDLTNDSGFITSGGIPEETDPIWGSEKGDYLTITDAEDTYEPLLPTTPEDPAAKFLDGNRQWSAISGSGVVIATGVEVDAGTDNEKVVTPKAMEDSSYIKQSMAMALAVALG